MDQFILRDASFQFTGRLRGVRHAMRGLQYMIATQHNAWLHAAATAMALGLSATFHIGRDEWCWIVLAIVGVWVAEAMNTAFEFLCDVASPAFHPDVKRAKDVAAGAVLVAAAGAIVIGVCVFWPHFREVV